MTYRCAKDWEEAGEPVPLEDFLELQRAARAASSPFLPAPVPPDARKRGEHGYCLRTALEEGGVLRPGHPEYDGFRPGLSLNEGVALLDRLGLRYVTDGPCHVLAGLPYVLIYEERKGPDGGHAVYTREAPEMLCYFETYGKVLWACVMMPMMEGEVMRFRVVSGEFAGRVGEMVGRKADPSYDDIELMFEGGVRRWFRMRDVEPAKDAAAEIVEGLARVEESNAPSRLHNPNGMYPACKPALGDASTCENCGGVPGPHPCHSSPREERWGPDYGAWATD